MGIVVRFPHHARASASVRLSTGRRACIDASASSVTAANPRPSAAETSGAHHSEGNLFRLCHFRTAYSEAPVSSASASSEGQSSHTARGVSSVMARPLGRNVLNVKANVSYDFGSVARDNAQAMPDRMSETEEKLAFIRRVRLAREARYPTQRPMLTILGIDQGTYKQYETRTPLPHRFIPKFCAATAVTMEWLLTGEGKGPVAVEHFPTGEPKPMPVRRTRRKKAA